MQVRRGDRCRKSVSAPARLVRRAGFAAASSFEPLEPRQLLATIQWDGGPSGLGTNFHDPVNWDGDVLPGVADDAVISVAANPTISITSTTSVSPSHRPRESPNQKLRGPAGCGLPLV